MANSAMAEPDPLELALDKFRDARQTLRETADLPEDRVARDSLLLRFVYTFEMAWQAAYAAMRRRGDRETPRVAFEALARAFKLGWLEDPDLWRRLREARNGVTHSYDEPLAIGLAAFVRAEALQAFDALAQRLETLERPA